MGTTTDYLLLIVVGLVPLLALHWLVAKRARVVEKKLAELELEILARKAD